MGQAITVPRLVGSDEEQPNLPSFSQFSFFDRPMNPRGAIEGLDAVGFPIVED
jgi:hypothetical protein